MNSKKWFKSKTIVINLLMIVGAVAAMIGEELGKGTGIGVIVINTVNIVMRYITNQPIGGGT